MKRKTLTLLLVLVLVVITAISVLAGCNTSIKKVFADYTPSSADSLTKITAVNATFDGATFVQAVGNLAIFEKGGNHALYNVATDTIVKDFAQYAAFRKVQSSDFAIAPATVPNWIFTTNVATPAVSFIFDQAGTQLWQGTAPCDWEIISSTLAKYTNESNVTKYALFDDLGTKVSELDYSLDINTAALSATNIGNNAEKNIKITRDDSFYYAIDLNTLTVINSVRHDNVFYGAAPDNGKVLGDGRVVVQQTITVDENSKDYTYTELDPVLGLPKKIKLRTYIFDAQNNKVKEVKVDFRIAYSENIYESSDFNDSYAKGVDNVVAIYKIKDKQKAVQLTYTTMSNNLKIEIEFDSIYKGFDGDFDYISENRVLLRSSGKTWAIADKNGKIVKEIAAISRLDGDVYGKAIIVENNIYSVQDGSYMGSFGKYSYVRNHGETIIVSKYDEVSASEKYYTTTVDAPGTIVEISDYNAITGIYSTKSDGKFNYYNSSTGAAVLTATDASLSHKGSYSIDGNIVARLYQSGTGAEAKYFRLTA